MKRISALILSAVLILSLAACGGQADTKATDNPAETTDNQTDSDVNISSNSTEEFLKTITPETAEAKGVCGADLTWYYQDNVLVIKGTGPMSDYFASFDERNYPWSDYYDKIGMVVIGEGCTSISKYAFYDFELLSKIIIPEGIESIGEYAFDYCRNLKEITLPASLKSVEFSPVLHMQLNAITFLGDAPEGAGDMIKGVKPSHGTIEVYYSGSGFDEYIEKPDLYYDITWIKQ